MLNVCKNKFGNNWKKFKNGFNIKSANLLSLCDPESIKNTFGAILYKNKVTLNALYNCSHTPKQFCSDY